MTPMMFEYELIERAKASPRHIVLPEGDDERVLRAAEILLRRGGRRPDDPGRPRRGAAAARRRSASTSTAPTSSTRSRRPLRDDFAARYFELRKHKGVTEELALRDASAT